MSSTPGTTTQGAGRYPGTSISVGAVMSPVHTSTLARLQAGPPSDPLDSRKKEKGAALSRVFRKTEA